MLGLGAGTLAHLVAAYHPGRRMEAWELDPAVIMAARKHMGEFWGTSAVCLDPSATLCHHRWQMGLCATYIYVMVQCHPCG